MSHLIAQCNICYIANVLKVADSVRSILNNSETSKIALSNGLLNYSAYAELILKEVESKTKKPVKKGTVIAALSRYAKIMDKEEDLIPNFTVKNILVKAGLTETTVEKTKGNLSLLKQLYVNEVFDRSEFMTVTQGISEITIICSEKSQKYISNLFKESEILASIPNLVAINLSFSEEFIQTTNVIYAILRTLALKKINIIELVSTYSELTFIIDKKDLRDAFLLLNNVYQG